MENRGTTGGCPSEARPAFRWMVSTCHDPAQSVEQGTLREDLYYRLAIVVIRLPALRERKADIPHLVRHFLAELCEAHNRSIPSVEPTLMQHLVAYPWPGNLDQLRDCLAYMLSTHDTDILQMRHLPRLSEHEGNSFMSHRT